MGRPLQVHRRHSRPNRKPKKIKPPLCQQWRFRFLVIDEDLFRPASSRTLWDGIAPVIVLFNFGGGPVSRGRWFPYQWEPGQNAGGVSSIRNLLQAVGISAVKTGARGDVGGFPIRSPPDPWTGDSKDHPVEHTRYSYAFWHRCRPAAPTFNACFAGPSTAKSGNSRAAVLCVAPRG